MGRYRYCRSASTTTTTTTATFVHAAEATIVQIFEICSQRGEQRADKSMTFSRDRGEEGRWLVRGKEKGESGKVNRAQSSDNSQTSENLEIPHHRTRVYPRWGGEGWGGSVERVNARSAVNTGGSLSKLCPIRLLQTFSRRLRNPERG